MGLIERIAKSGFALYWPPGGDPDGYGQPTYGAPVCINARWEDLQQTIEDPKGDRVISQSQIYVDIDLKIQGILLEVPLAPATTFEEVDGELVQMDSAVILALAIASYEDKVRVDLPGFTFDANSPTTMPGYRPIVQLERTPTIRNRNRAVRIAFL